MTRAAATYPVDFPEPRFRPLDGHVELAVAEAAQTNGPRPQRVTAILSAMCETLGGDAADAALLRRVSVAGREWLLLRAGLQFYRGSNWFEASCPACSAHFDLECDLREVPANAAGEGFPTVEVETGRGTRIFEAPNGAHEEAIAEHRADNPRRELVGLCGMARDAEAEAARFSAADIDLIDSALEAISPEIATDVATVCPECGEPTRLAIDPLAFAFPAPARILRDVAVIAQAFGWSEDAILSLPSHRRNTYVSLASEARDLAPRRRAAR